MERVVRIDETEVTMRATAAVLIRYRSAFGRDLIHDLQATQGSTEEGLADGTAETISRLAYVMDTDKSKGTFDEWLDKWSPLGVVYAAPEILGLWTESQRTLSEGKKK